MPPRSAPGGARSGPRGAKEPPRATQERPKSRPRGEQKEHKRIQLSFPLLGRAREASGRHFEAIWERFGSLRGSIFKPFSFHFAMLEAMLGARPRERRSKRHPSKTLSGGAERAREA